MISLSFPLRLRIRSAALFKSAFSPSFHFVISWLHAAVAIADKMQTLQGFTACREDLPRQQARWSKAFVLHESSETRAASGPQSAGQRKASIGDAAASGPRCKHQRRKHQWLGSFRPNAHDTGRSRRQAAALSEGQTCGMVECSQLLDLEPCQHQTCQQRWANRRLQAGQRACCPMSGH